MMRKLCLRDVVFIIALKKILYLGWIRRRRKERERKGKTTLALYLYILHVTLVGGNLGTRPSGETGNLELVWNGKGQGHIVWLSCHKLWRYGCYVFRVWLRNSPVWLGALDCGGAVRIHKNWTHLLAKDWWSLSSRSSRVITPVMFGMETHQKPNELCQTKSPIVGALGKDHESVYTDAHFFRTSTESTHLDCNIQVLLIANKERSDIVIKSKAVYKIL